MTYNTVNNKELNFRVVESSSNEIEDIYEEFKKDFLNPKMSVIEIKKKYDLGRAQYKHLRLQVLDETGLQEKPSLRGGRNLTIRDSRYIVIHKNGTATIFKSINKIKKNFGRYPNFESACLVRDKLVEENWNEDLAEKLKKKYSIRN